jgi:hypothetical protein
VLVDESLRADATSCSVTVREALRALAVPEPEPFRQVIPTADDRARWQAWHERYLEALSVAKAFA